MKIYDFFDFEKTLGARLLSFSEYPWDALDMLREYIMRVGRGLDREKFEEVKRDVWIAKSASVSHSAILMSPLIVDEEAKIGVSSVVRSSIVGKGAVIGSLCEIFDSILFDGARAPQHNYISDSIIGHNVRFGAGAIVSNRSADQTKICCLFGDELISCQRRKFGAVVGDYADIGCSSVLMAGCVVERGASISPLTRARGFVSADGSYAGEKILFDML